MNTLDIRLDCPGRPILTLFCMYCLVPAIAIIGHSVTGFKKPGRARAAHDLSKVIRVDLLTESILGPNRPNLYPREFREHIQEQGPLYKLGYRQVDKFMYEAPMATPS